MGTLAAGIKDIFSTAKTTGTNVMLSGNDGTPDGHITMANLASVLGVDIHNPPLTDLNMDEKRNVFGVIEPSTLNVPYAGYGIVSHLSSGQTSYLTQLVFMHTPTSGLYIRYKWNVWTAWQKIELDIPAFYKSYANLTALSNALGVSKSVGYISSYASSNDANDFCGETLFGMTNTDSTNIPVSSYGFLLNFNCGTNSYPNFGVQIWFQSISTMKVYYRVFWNGWQQWTEL